MALVYSVSSFYLRSSVVSLRVCWRFLGTRNVRRATGEYGLGLLFL
jgi:hypothetical protein